MLWLIIPFLILLGVILFFQLNPQFGGTISAQDRIRFQQSPQWDGKKFINQVETRMDMSLSKVPGLLKEQRANAKVRKPASSIPVLALDQEALMGGEKAGFVWYGHSVLLLRIQEKNFLIDPMLGPDAAPIAPFPTRRFTDQNLGIIADLPPIDAVLLTHDHYDHLDYASIKRLIPRVNRWLVALGVGRHLRRWGVPSDQIQEFDWWDETVIDGIRLIFTPSRHFSGRGMTDRAQSLWGGWVFLTENERIYWSGDGGYGPHFKEVGDTFGPFDWGFMECGQYNERWHAIHLFPEESVQAAVDARVNMAIPVHWGGFALALHHWVEPVRRFSKEAQTQNLPFCIPQPGQVVRAGSEQVVNSAWWEKWLKA